MILKKEQGTNLGKEIKKEIKTFLDYKTCNNPKLVKKN